jgi:hypothetical protein
VQPTPEPVLTEREAMTRPEGFLVAPRHPWEGLPALAVTVPAAGVLVGVLWSVLAALVIGHSDPSEAQASADGTLALLELVAGAVTAALLCLRPGRNPAARFALIEVAVSGGALLSWAAGAATGAPELRAKGVILLWPFLTAAITVLRALAGLIFRGE